MLQYDRNDVSKGIYINKLSASKEFRICHCWYFLNKGIKFQPYVCNGCHEVLVMSIILNSTAILNIPSADYSCVVLLSAQWMF